MTNTETVTEHIKKLMLETGDAEQLYKLAEAVEALSRASQNDVHTMQQLEYVVQSRQNRAVTATTLRTATAAGIFNNQV